MGELKGKQWQPRDIAALCYEYGWTDAKELVTAVAVCLSESQGYQKAYNENKDENGVVKSKDIGLFQINIPGSKIGTDEETALFEDVGYNLERARILYEKRGFQPWYAYTLKVYLRDSYIKRATRGVGNFLADEMLKTIPTDTLKGEPYVHTLDTPVLNYQYRVELLNGACSRIVKMARAIKPSVNATIDAKLEEIAKVATTAINEAKK